MAPFKLKFRMGSSRSGSQETDTDTSNGGGNGGGNSSSVQQPLLLNNAAHMRDSNTTLDSEYNSLGSLIANDQRNLLRSSNSSINDRTGYTNPTLTDNLNEISNIIPQGPPPSYEHVLEENRLANLDKDNNPTTIIISCCGAPPHALTGGGCDDVTCASSVSCLRSHHQSTNNIQITLNEHSLLNSRAESIESPVYSYSTMSTPSQEDLLGSIDGSCDPLFSAHSHERIDSDERPTDETNVGGRRCDGSGNSSMDNNNDRCGSESDMDNQSDEEDVDDDDDDWDSHEHQFRDLEIQSNDTIINNKSTKEIYKAVAKQWGITCKMSEQCRCMECQSNYFDCEYEENENQKTDGGLAAGTPMFISEVMHGSACTIL